MGILAARSAVVVTSISTHLLSTIAIIMHSQNNWGKKEEDSFLVLEDLDLSLLCLKYKDEQTTTAR